MSDFLQKNESDQPFVARMKTIYGAKIQKINSLADEPSNSRISKTSSISNNLAALNLSEKQPKKVPTKEMFEAVSEFLPENWETLFDE